MLVLSVNMGDYVVINENIIVKVVRMNDDLKLAIEAPKDVRIERGEVYERTHSRPAKLAAQKK